MTAFNTIKARKEFMSSTRLIVGAIRAKKESDIERAHDAVARGRAKTASGTLLGLLVVAAATGTVPAMLLGVGTLGVVEYALRRTRKARLQAIEEAAKANLHRVREDVRAAHRNAKDPAFQGNPWTRKSCPLV